MDESFDCAEYSNESHGNVYTLLCFHSTVRVFSWVLLYYLLYCRVKIKYMFRYVMLCYVRYVMLCYVMLLCCVMLLCYVMLCYVMSATVSCARPNFYSCFHLLQIREADWLSGAVY